MAKTGRPPKPTALHVLNGNPSKKKDLGKNEPMPTPVVTIPAPPEWLHAHGKIMWERLSPELYRLGLLTQADLEAFTAACNSWGVYVECQEHIRLNGLTYKYTNKGGGVNDVERPEVRIGQKSLDQFRALCSEFGLTPAARTRIEVKADNGKDPMEDLLSGVK